jgi:tRNA pseudouridine13 synthase
MALCRYPDFKVNEIDFGGNVARLTNFDIPPPAAGIARVEDALPSAAAVSTAYETLLGGAAAATKKDDLLAFLEQAKLHKDAASANKAPEPLVLDSLPDKDLRRSVHQLLKNLSWAPPISTKAVTISNPTPGEPELQGIQVICTATDARKSQTGQKRKWQQERQEWPGGKNRFLRFALLKENSDTHHTLISMSKVLHINANVFNVAGTKDKRGVTVQWVTAFSVTPEKLLRINNILRGIRVGNFSYVPEALRLGDLRGNKFDIVLRGLSAESSDMVEAAAAALKTTGFINYYGLQRFGSSVIPTHHVGKALLRGEWEEAIKCIMTPAPNTKEVITSAIADFLNGGSPSKCLSMLPRNLVAESAILTVLAKEGRAATVNALLSIPRNLKSMYLHAYQSYIWNEAASERISKFGAEKVVAGDLVVPRSTLQAARSAKAKNATDQSASSNASEDVPDEEVAAEPHVVTEEEAALNTFSIEDLVLPLPGRKIVYPKNEIAQIYENLMEKDGISMTTPATKVKEFSQEAMPGGYRHVLFKPKDLEYSVLRYDDKETELAQTDADVLNGAPPLVLPENGKYLALRLAFSLPSSTYATMLIRELTKMPTSVEFSKGLQHPE